MNKLRPELSKKNEFHISKHRYYELKHFCLQYKEWKRIYNSLCDSVPNVSYDTKAYSDDARTERMMSRQRYLDNMTLVEETSYQVDKIFGPYILKGVTEGLTYSYMRTAMNIPCCRDAYYEMYRKFFYVLSKKKDLA